MTPADRVAPPARRRRFVWIVLGLLLLVVGAFVGRLLYRYLANERLVRDAIAEIEATDPHWRMEAIEARRVVVPDEENSANVIHQARAPLRRMTPAEARRWERMKADLAPQTRLNDEQYRDVTAALKAAGAGAEIALTLEHYPRGRHPINYSPDGVSTLLTHADDVIIVYERALAPLILARIHEGDTATAIRACWAIANAGHSLGDEPMVVSQLVRARYHRAAVRGLKRLLGQGEVPEADLAAFQTALATDAAYDPWETSLRGERALVFRALEAIGNGTLKPQMLNTLTNFAGPPPTPIDNVRQWVSDRFPPDTRPTEAWALRYCNRLLEAGKLPWPDRRTAVDALAAELPNAPPFADNLFENILKFAVLFQSAQARGRFAVTALAVERYRLRHGRWPESLAALVPDLLPALATDPFDGQPLRYRRLDDGVVIYSVGEDRQDNGGTLNDNSPAPPGTDIGFRLWDVPKRRQAPPSGNDPKE